MLSVYRTFNNRLLTFDPGYLNLRSAIRGTLAVTVSYFVLVWLARTFSATPTLPFLGVLITMMSVIVVNDSKRSDQKITTLIIAAPASLAAVASVSLAAWPYARLFGFLFCTFAAVFVRRFGPRWTGVGIVSFMAFSRHSSFLFISTICP